MLDEHPAMDATGIVDVFDDEPHTEVLLVCGKRADVVFHPDQDGIVRDALSQYGGQDQSMHGLKCSSDRPAPVTLRNQDNAPVAQLGE